MSVSQLLLPLRVPELGPHLGKLVVGTGRAPGGFRLDAFRYRLVTRMFESAGEARRLAARGDRSAAVAAVGRSVWLEAWEEVASGVAEALVEQLDRHLDAEGLAVGMPRGLRQRVRLGSAEKRSIAARLGSAGAGLVPVLDALEDRAQAALDATPKERDTVEAWQEALRTAARRLEAAWLGLEDGIELEVQRWRRVADDVARWRKPLWPVVLLGSLALAAAVWLGLVLGGYLEPPPWFARAWQLLPWT